MFNWYAAFTGTVALLGTTVLVTKKNPAGLVPLLPLSFVSAYQYDFCYGNKLDRVVEEAGRILEEERTALRFAPPANNLLISQTEYAAVFAQLELRQLMTDEP